MQNIFSHLNNITLEKKEFLGDEGWNSWMINRYISMDENYVELVNIIQKNTYQLSPKQIYTIYRDIIPKRKVWLGYIKSKKEKTNPDLLVLLAEWFECSEREVKHYLDLLSKTDLEEILSKFGKDKRQIKELLK